MAMSVEVRRLENVTECAICADNLTDARVLPCVHTFCLKCVDRWSQNKKSGEKVSCPICRKEFQIPDEGTAALPKNSFIEKLLEVQKMSATLTRGDVLCEVCCDDREKSGEKLAEKASVYCVECHRNMCEQCCGHHQKFRLPGIHKLVELSSDLDVDELLLKFTENVCDKHPDKCIEIYCFDCRAAVCMMCYIKSHNSHKCSDIKEVAEDLGKQMSANVGSLADKVTECQTVLRNIEENENKFRSKAAETEKLINERAEKMKQLVDDYKQSLCEQLALAKDKQLKQTANAREEIERHQIVMENFIRYANEVKQKGTACDIAKLALNTRAEELQKLEIGTDVGIDYNVTDVDFTEAQQTDDQVKRVFGNLSTDVHGYFHVHGQLLHTVPRSVVPVTGIALLKDQLFVSFGKKITVYCPTTFQFQRYLQFYYQCCGNRYTVVQNQCQCHQQSHYRQQSPLLRDMVACDVSNSLYASSQNYSSIYKVALNENNMISSWSVGSSPQGLSMTNSHNLLVVFSGNSELSEYSTDGNLLRQINLQPEGISNPVHAVQISEDQFAVTHHGPTHQFSIVGSDGQLIRSYSGNAGDLKEPRGIAADERGRVFVADQSNNRILVISCNSTSARQFLLTPDCTLDGPYCLHYDSANKRLYIGEESGGRVVCCQL